MTRPAGDPIDPLFNGLPPIVRPSDPHTSHAAAKAISSPRGSRESHCAAILDLVRRHPGLIVAALEELYPAIGRHDMTKRVSDLVRRGLVEYRGARTNPESGKLCRRVYARSGCST